MNPDEILEGIYSKARQFGGLFAVSGPVSAGLRAEAQGCSCMVTSVDTGGGR